MFNEFIRFGLWPVTIVAVSLLAAGVWRMNVRLAAVGVLSLIHISEPTRPY